MHTHSLLLFLPSNWNLLALKKQQHNNNIALLSLLRICKQLHTTLSPFRLLFTASSFSLSGRAISLLSWCIFYEKKMSLVSNVMNSEYFILTFRWNVKLWNIKLTNGTTDRQTNNQKYGNKIHFGGDSFRNDCVIILSGFAIGIT